jgi:hypothetical protein
MEVHAWGGVTASGGAEDKWVIVDVYDARGSCSVQQKQEVTKLAAV